MKTPEKLENTRKTLKLTNGGMRVVCKNVEFEVLKDCVCAGYLHEISNYPREGLVKKEFKKGEKVKLVEEFHNFYGRYIRCSNGKVTCDIEQKYLSEPILKEKIFDLPPKP